VAFFALFMFISQSGMAFYGKDQDVWYFHRFILRRLSMKKQNAPAGNGAALMAQHQNARNRMEEKVRQIGLPADGKGPQTTAKDNK
jgi:hypothetical protein